jgi:hypothetical protein
MVKSLKMQPLNKNCNRRISKEKKRLEEICADIIVEKREVAEGLLQRAAYARILLEEYEADIKEGGYTELFTQSERTPPYERERPVVRLYNALFTNYQKIIKQLTDLLPNGEGDSITKSNDGFSTFINRR